MRLKIIISLSVLFLAFIAGVNIVLQSDDVTHESVYSIKNGERPDYDGTSDDAHVYLYFADRNKSFLKTEERILAHPESAVMFATVIIKSLIKGSQSGLMRTIPSGTVLKALYVTKDKVAIADFSQEISDNHPGGSQLEYLTIYSIVNSLTLNIPRIEKVQILIDGQEQSTLAGHIDLHLPFSANMLIVR